MNKLYLSISMLLAVASCSAFPPEVTIKVEVVDLYGKPVEGARVAFLVGAKITASHTANSDAKGLAEGTVKTTSGDAEVGVSKEGYYSTWVPRRLQHKGDFKNGSWEPNPLVVRAVLRPKVNPLPMYVSSVSFWEMNHQKLPESNEVGYYLEKGTWAVEDKSADIVIRRIPLNGNPNECLYELKFTRPHDGVIVVPFVDPFEERYELKSPAVAPEQGYASRVLFDSKRQSFMSESDKTPRRANVYILRLRTEVDEKGRVVSAYYAKIYAMSDGINLYLNPEKNNRGLEFAVGKNLLSEKQARFHPNDP